MKGRLIALILALAILVVILILFKGLAAEAQQAGKGDRIGLLGYNSPDPGRLSLLPQTAFGGPIAIVDDRVYREGVFLVVDALVANKMTQRIEGVEVTVEFHDFFGKVKRVEHTWASPLALGPGQLGALRVVTPYSEGVRRLLYRFTWRQNGAQFQAVVRRDIWTIGSATHDPKLVAVAD